ncbi:MAG: hypothetical protein VYD19_10415 [Myxococcota bacterium]|nr:hypothetical protein [Myxococcota bacterium]
MGDQSRSQRMTKESSPQSRSERSRIKWTVSLFAVTLSLLVFTLVACNDHPVEPLDQVLSAVSRQENRLPAKTKLDFLFVIDDSGSMCEEQESLAQNFQTFSNFLFRELQGAADYRIAVVSTDLGSAEDPSQDAARFVYKKPPPQVICQVSTPMGPMNQSRETDTADCPADGGLSPIISAEELENECAGSGESCVQEALERRFRCMATRGTEGFIHEKGLEAMRKALSCQGPNAELFSPCCEYPGTAEAFYNPACRLQAGEQEPLFLRPDATLVVIIISDENDCSTPADFPQLSSRRICRPGGTEDLDGDFIPDIYRTECGAQALECYRSECSPETINEGNSLSPNGPVACKRQRCDINYGEGNACEYRHGDLTDVDEYRRFLQGLKARPLDQLLVATIVAPRNFLPSGQEIRYLGGSPVDDRCSDPTFQDLLTETCCPGGLCRGIDPEPSCTSEYGVAFAGSRYLDLTDAMGDNGLGCPPGADDDQNVCLNICGGSFETPLQRIRDRVADLLNEYCVARLPQCLVPVEGGGERPCDLNNPQEVKAYAALRVSQQCLLTEQEGGSCDAVVEPRTLGPEEFNLRVGFSADGTATGICVVLEQVPPAGSEIFVEYITSISSEDDVAEAAPPAMGGVPEMPAAELEMGVPAP